MVQAISEEDQTKCVHPAAEQDLEIKTIARCIEVASMVIWYPCTPTDAPYNRGLNNGALAMQQEIVAALLKEKFTRENISASSPTSGERTAPAPRNTSVEANLPEDTA